MELEMRVREVTRYEIPDRRAFCIRVLSEFYVEERNEARINLISNLTPGTYFKIEVPGVYEKVKLEWPNLAEIEKAKAMKEKFGKRSRMIR